jgi:hypothetical protein
MVMVILVLAGRGFAAESIWLEAESSTDFTFNRHGWYQDTNVRKDFMSPGTPEGISGDWLAHYSNNNPADTAYSSYTVTVTEGGQYTGWIRCNPIEAVYRVSVDASPLQDLDVRDYREIVNIVQGIDIRWLGWVKLGAFTFTPGPHSIRIEVEYNPARNETHGGIDCICFVNFAWEPAGVLKPGGQVEIPGPGVWFPLRPGDDAFSADSITDMSTLLHTPAGRYGHLQRQGNRFEFQADPGKPVKFWGICVGSILPTEELQRRQARLYAKHGVNLVRLHPVESVLGLLQKDPGTGVRSLDPARLDTFDRWFSILKERGIYMDWSCFYPHVITRDDGYPANLYNELPDANGGKSSSGMVNFMQVLQDAEWAWLKVLLEHRNPYTGLAYKDEPALAFIETHNEDNLFWHFPLNNLAAGTDYPNHTAELKRMWQQWVSARYGTDTALQNAWGAGMRPGDSVSNPAMNIYGAWQMEADGPNWGIGIVPEEKPRLGDFIRFLADTQRGCYERRKLELQQLGFKGVFVTTAWKAGGAAAQAANLYCDDVGDAIDRHAYFGGGVGGWVILPGAVYNDTHLSQPGRGILAGDSYDSGGETVVLYQVEDKPTLMSEWTQSPPNQWKAEIAPLYAFYGMGLQGWDASVHFAGSLARMGSGWPSNLRAPSPFTTETPHYLGQFPALAFSIYKNHCREADLAGARRLSPDSIFGGFDALSRDLPGGGYPAEPNLRTPPEVMAIGRVTCKTADGLPPSSKCTWNTYWDGAARVIQSMTGEERWDYGNRVVTIQSEKTQAVIGWAGGKDFDLPGVQIHAITDFMSLLFTPLDDRPLKDSEHILITALARDKQLGTEYNADASQLLKAGGPPLLLEPVQAVITFKGSPVISAKVVDIYGVPTGRDVDRNGNTVTIDGRYETYYYEVKKEASTNRCLCRSQAASLSPLNPPKSTIFLAAPGPDGISLNPAAAFAQVPYVCSFTSGMTDPEPVLQAGARPLFYYEVSNSPTQPIRVIKETGLQTLRFFF